MDWEQIVPSDNRFPYGSLLSTSNWKIDLVSGIVFSYSGSGCRFEIINIQLTRLLQIVQGIEILSRFNIR